MKKDIIISAQRIRTELKWLLAGFILAIVLNVYSIIKFKTSWVDMVSTIHILLLTALIIYIMLLFFRGLGSLIIRFTSGRIKD